MALSPDTASVKRDDGAWRETDSARVTAGALVRVRPGERLPLDGVVTAGASSVDQAPITGESVAVAKGVGDAVYAGSINGEGLLEFRTTGGRDDTTLARIVRSVQEAQAQRAPTQRIVDRFAQRYTPVVFGLATLGNHRFVEEEGACGAPVETALRAQEAQGRTAAVLMRGRSALAVLAVADVPRETSVQALRELHALGVRTVLLSGDNQVTAEAIARAVGIDDARGELLPEEKRAAIEALRAEHERVGMVGDGVNDAPALAAATMGFAMGAAGTDTTIETADVAFMRDDLRALPEFIRLSRRTAAILKQNLVFAVGSKAVFFVQSQVVRIGGAATKTAFGLVPHGNTGGANVSPFARIYVPPDLEARIQEARATSG